MNQIDPNAWLEKIAIELVSQLERVPADSQLEWLDQIQSVIESCRSGLYKKQLEQFWQTLGDIYPDLRRLEIQLDYVPQFGVFELWSLNSHTSDGEVYQWSVHWFDKPIEDAKKGLWGDEILDLEKSHDYDLNTNVMWSWSQRFLSWFQHHLPVLLLDVGVLEGISAFSVEYSATGLKLTTEKI